jgi:predicted enzyme related to lactoylglutathione lyase
MRPSLLVLAVVLFLIPRHAIAQAPGTPSAAAPALSEQIVFLYYSDLRVAEDFFGKVLGLEKTMDKEWVKIYRTIGGSSIGAVKEGRGFHKTSPSKPVMITWAVDNIQPWYERVVKSGVKVLKAPQVATDPPAKSFLVADPTGYTFEFLEWVRE